RERLNGTLHDVDLAGSAMLLLETCGSKPNFVTSWDGFSSFVENSLCIFKRLQASKREPKFHTERDELDSAPQKQFRVFRIFLKLDGFLPEHDGLREDIKGFADDLFLCSRV